MENIYVANEKIHILAESFADAEDIYYSLNDEEPLVSLTLLSKCLYRRVKV